MKGTQVDGHRYIETAIEKVAVAVLCEDLPEEKAAHVTYIQVQDTTQAAGVVATVFYG